MEEVNRPDFRILIGQRVVAGGTLLVSVSSWVLQIFILFWIVFRSDRISVCAFFSMFFVADVISFISFLSSFMFPSNSVTSVI